MAGREYAVARFRDTRPLENYRYETEDAARWAMDTYGFPCWVISRICTEWEVS